MTSGAALLGLDVVVLLQKLTEIFLVRDAIAVSIFHHVRFEVFLRVVVEIVDLFEWTEVLLGLTVAVETKAHRMTLGVVNHFHLVHIAVTALAGHASIDVGRVVEIDVIGSAVNPDPLDRLPFHLLATPIQNRLMVLIHAHCVAERR